MTKALKVLAFAAASVALPVTASAEPYEAARRTCAAERVRVTDLVEWINRHSEVSYPHNSPVLVGVEAERRCLEEALKPKSKKAKAKKKTQVPPSR